MKMEDKPIDLRSDTVTRPTTAMREAMMNAEVGDDVYLEDPTVNKLQETAATLFKREAALFVPSGTMGNEVAIHILTQPGQEVILEESSHIFNFELSSMAIFSGVQARPIRGHRGIIDPEEVKRAIRPKAYYISPTALICLENTHNHGGGTIYPLELIEGIISLARSEGIHIHLDGARIFNAAVALNREVSDLTKGFDTIMFCLSKGLSAPVGSMLVGSRELIEKARIARKMLGGGMRQVGVLAAAGLVALETMVDRLKIDHQNAAILAEGIARIKGLRIDSAAVETNIVIFQIEGLKADAPEFAKQLNQSGLLCHPFDHITLRMVTHKDVNREDILQALDIMETVCAKLLQ